MQVDPLACFLIVLFHILLPKAQERVHADIQAAIRLLGGRRDKNSREVVKNAIPTARIGTDFPLGTLLVIH